jgi:hypothetical protein
MQPTARRLVAEVAQPTAGGHRWLRILGDDERGYLLAGDLEALEEIWFPSLDEALTEAERAGVPRDAWGVEDSPPAAVTERARRPRW